MRTIPTKIARITSACVLALVARFAIATPLTYIINPALSALTISGTWGSQPLVSQYNDVNPSANGLSTFYQGQIIADRTDNTIQIMGGTIVAQASASYRPFNGPADYGVANSLIFPLLGAVRNFTFSLSSSVVGDSDSFDSDLISGVMESGQFDYADIGYFTTPMTEYDNSSAISGNLILASGEGTLIDAGGSETLSIPINTNFTIEADDQLLTIDLSGQVVATAELPEPAYIAFITICAVGFCRRRAKRGRFFYR